MSHNHRVVLEAKYDTSKLLSEDAIFKKPFQNLLLSVANYELSDCLLLFYESRYYFEVILIDLD